MYMAQRQTFVFVMTKRRVPQREEILHPAATATYNHNIIWKFKLMLYYNKPTRCSYSQSILFYCRVTLHVSGAFHTHHLEYTKMYHSLRYRSYYRCTYL